MASPPVIPELPAQLRPIQSFMKVAQDIERIDPVVAYWLRLHATETGFKIDKSSAESKSFLMAVISWLEYFKKKHHDNEAVTNPTVGQAHYENFAITIFNKADTLDREGTATKQTVLMFYMATVMFDAMSAFGSITDDISEKAKYARFKAAYIQKCLKTGQVPKPGPIEGDDLEADATKPTAGTDLETNMPPAPPSFQPTIGPPQPGPDTMPPGPSDSFTLKPSPAPKPNKPPPVTDFNKSLSGSDANRNSSTNNSSKLDSTSAHASNGVSLTADDLAQGQKFCKFANSALQYDDVPTAVLYLEKALKLLTTGQRED